jgi:hypothetical protein
VAVLVRIVLALGFLLAHTPVCKVVLLSPRTQADSSRPCERPPCCAKCVKQVDPSHTESPKPRTPAKPLCPTGTECVLCGASAVILATVGVTELPVPAVGRLAEFGRVLSTAGFHTLLDRPPRG